MADTKLNKIYLNNMENNLPTEIPANEVTVIGRGPFLMVMDRRVSRNHAHLEIKDGKLYLTSIHVNPCFYIKAGEKEKKVIHKNEVQCLENNDVISLLPDDIHFKVKYESAPVNGNVSKEITKDVKETLNKENGTNSTSKIVKKDVDEDWDQDDETKSDDENRLEIDEQTTDHMKDDETKIEAKVDDKDAEVKVEKKIDADVKNEKEEKSELPEGSPKAGPSTTVIPPGQKEMALPVERKRKLPDWLVRAAEAGPTPEKKKPAPHTPANSKRVQRTAAVIAAVKQEDSLAEEEDEIMPTKKRRGRPAAKKKPIRDSPSEEEDEDEPVHRTPKAKPVQTLKPGTRTPRRRDKYSDDEDYDDSPVGKAKAIPRRTARPPTPESFTPVKRPVRAAKYARGSYVDDYIVEDELSDDSDDYGLSKRRDDEDSDFVAAEEDDSGSDWGTKKSSKTPKGKGRTRTGSVRNTRTPRGRGRSRRSQSGDDSDEFVDEYIPRPSKTRGRAKKTTRFDSEDSEDDSYSPPAKTKARGRPKKAAKSESEEDEEPPAKAKTKVDKPKKRRRCEFGEKCYRKNPDHRKELCHPGDETFDEEDEDEDDKPLCPYGSACYRTNPKHKEDYSHSASATSRPKRDTAGKRSVLDNDDDDDGGVNTYDYNDSFIDNTMESSEEETFDPADEDSDYDPESEDVGGLVKEAKSFSKNKKMQRPTRSR